MTEKIPTPSDFFYIKTLEELAKKLGKAIEKITYPELEKKFPNGAVYPAITNFIRQKKVEWLKAHPDQNSPRTTLVSQKGRVLTEEELKQ